MRWAYLLAAALMAAALVGACGGTPSKPHTTNNDGGSTATTGSGGSSGSGTCTDSTQCNSGTFCINGHCGTCDSASRPLACTGDTYCNHVTHDCESRVVDGGTSGSSGTSGTSGSSGTTGTVTACSARADCLGADACLNANDGGYCSSVAADAGCSTNNDCDKAYICQAHQCVYGCFNNLDCHGTQQPVCISGNPGHCGACTANSQCLADENCEQGQCVAKSPCTTAATCGGLGCVGGYCSPCSGAADCVSPDVCDTGTGHCVAPATGCSSDTECQSQHNGSPSWYCNQNVSDGGAPQCKLGCVPDSYCSPLQTGCCNIAGGQTCDSTTHACVAGGTTTSTTGSTGTSSTTGSTTTTTGSGSTGNCGSFTCDQCFQLGENCDQTNCQCIGGGSSGSTGATSGGSSGGGCGPTGDQGQPCNSDCTCNSGLSCYDIGGGGPYDSSTGICGFYYCSYVLVCG